MWGSNVSSSKQANTTYTRQCRVLSAIIATGPVASPLVDEDINRLLTSLAGTKSATQYANRLTLIYQFPSAPTYLNGFLCRIINFGFNTQQRERGS